MRSTLTVLTIALALAGCTEHPQGPDPAAPSVVGEFGVQAESLYADLVGTTLRIASDRDDVCLPPVDHVTGPWQANETYLMVWLVDDVVPGCEGAPAVVCVDLGSDLASPRFDSVELMLPLTGAPTLPIKRDVNARTRGPQCPDPLVVPARDAMIDAWSD